MDLFVQDNWRVTSNLTLNLGLRWDPYLAPYDRQGRVVCFQPGAQSKRYPKAPVGLIYGGDNADPGCPVSGMQNSWWNMAPRFGFAYRLTADGKTSVRGGIGFTIRRSRLPTSTPLPTSRLLRRHSVLTMWLSRTRTEASASPIRSRRSTDPIRGPDVDFTLPAAVRWTFAKDFRIPLITTWNLIFERQVGPTGF